MDNKQQLAALKAMYNKLINELGEYEDDLYRARMTYESALEDVNETKDDIREVVSKIRNLDPDFEEDYF